MNNNGVIRIGRKGLKKFAFGADGAPFEIDVVVAFQQWIEIDESFRPDEKDENGNRPVPLEKVAEFHQAAVQFAVSLSCQSQTEEGADIATASVTTAEALDFIARLRECYDELIVFFQPKSSAGPGSPASSEVELRFSEEGK